MRNIRSNPLLDEKRKRVVLLKIKQKNFSSLNEDNNLSAIQALESRFTIHRLANMLSKKNVTLKECENLLINRWQIIQDTDASYMQCFSSLANKFCVLLAKEIATQKDIAWQLIIMPTLLPQLTYISSSYTDNLPLEKLILRNNNTEIVVIDESLEFTLHDGRLKASTVVDGKVAYLDPDEINRILSRDRRIERVYDCSVFLYQQRENGPSVGATIKRLINGLFRGDKYHEGKELEAGKSALESIVDFSLYYNGLTQSLRKKIDSAEYKSGGATRASKPETFKKQWDTLTSDKLRREGETVYCVNSIAQEIRTILEENKNLYDFYPDGIDEKQLYSSLEEELNKAREKMEQAFERMPNHKYYGKKGDQFLLKKMLTLSSIVTTCQQGFRLSCEERDILSAERQNFFKNNDQKQVDRIDALLGNCASKNKGSPHYAGSFFSRKRKGARAPNRAFYPKPRR